MQVFLGTCMNKHFVCHQSLHVHCMHGFPNGLMPTCLFIQRHDGIWCSNLVCPHHYFCIHSSVQVMFSELQDYDCWCLLTVCKKK